jgi:2'-5' RNA ligase
MAKPRNMLRLFVAAYPPIELVRQMRAALKELDLPPHRLTPLDQIHLTLQFIGDTPTSDLDDTIESVRRSTQGLEVTELTPERLITLPERGPKRLIAVQTDADKTVLELQRRLAQRLASNVRRKPGNRFLPHLTICRFRSPTKMDAVAEPLDLPPFEVAEIKLMRSTLSPQGSQHHEVATVELSEPK